MVNIKDLSFSYKKASLFDGLSLDFEPGRIYGLLGLNGAGKSTLLKLISGMQYPQDGQCKVFGMEASERAPEMLEDIFYLPEEMFLPSISGELYMKVNSPFYKRFDKDRFFTYCNEFQLDLEKKLNNLSYGQKKKYLIAFGLASNTRLFILDEPTNGLDIPSKGQFRRLMAEAVEDQRIFIISTHQVKDVEFLIDDLVIIDQGVLVIRTSLAYLSGKLKLVKDSHKPEDNDDSVLYWEAAIGGFQKICKNNGEDEGILDLELLFNMFIYRKNLGNSWLASKEELA